MEEKPNKGTELLILKMALSDFSTHSTRIQPHAMGDLLRFPPATHT